MGKRRLADRAERVMRARQGPPNRWNVENVDGDSMAQPVIPGVVFQPHTHEGLRRGISQLAAIIRPTLGPQPRHVVVEQTFRDKTPELLDNAALIARRIVQLSDRDADPGAMLLRHALWRIHDEVGDGTATAAVLFDSVYNQALRYLAAGGNAMRLRRALKAVQDDVLAELDRQTRPIWGRHNLAALAESLCFDAALAAMLGEIFDIVGEYGQIDVGTAHTRTLERQFVEGTYWPSSTLSAHMYTDQVRQRAELTEAALLISDLEIDDPRAVVPLIAAAVEQGCKGLVVMAQKLAEPVIATLLSANRDPQRFVAIAVQTPGLGALEQARAMEELAMLA
ncbi:MAG TPA: TCP-1/cpn60 chaperonin family protein, partial [Roseiflexaceae bacterium]|nr:TCP-1/cpn60 chaperonin family protein [Roseiflexaceae bacterium]